MRWSFHLLLLLTPAALQAQEKQMIIRIPAQEESRVISIGRQLNCIEGIHFSGYAKNVSCLLLRYDTAIIRDESIIPAVIRHLNNKLRVELITGITAYDVIDGKLPPQYTSGKK